MRYENGYRAKIARGALGGLIGALGMIPMMFGMVRMGISEEPFPMTATRGVIRRVGLYSILGKHTTDEIAWEAHLCYGATFGALFGFLKGRFRLPT